MNIKKLKILTVILTLVLAVNISFSGPRDKFGTSAAPELLIPVGSVGTSLAGANLSNVTGLEAMYWNPAGLAMLNSSRAEVMFSHMNYFADMKVEYFGGVASLGSLGNLGFSVKSLNVGDIAETTEAQPEGTGAIFHPNYIIANLGYGKQMTDRIRFGTNIKVINESVANINSTGFAFDFGIQYVGGKTGLTFGIALKNLGPSMRFNGSGLDRVVVGLNGQTSVERVTLQDYDLPTNLEIGVGYSKNIGSKVNFALSAAFQNSSFSSDEYRFGLEMNYMNYFFIRGALNATPNFNSGDRLFGPTFGAGVRYPFGSVSVGFDYAYRTINSDSGFKDNNQFFTLTLGF